MLIDRDQTSRAGTSLGSHFLEENRKPKWEIQVNREVHRMGSMTNYVTNDSDSDVGWWQPV